MAACHAAILRGASSRIGEDVLAILCFQNGDVIFKPVFFVVS